MITAEKMSLANQLQKQTLANTVVMNRLNEYEQRAKTLQTVIVDQKTREKQELANILQLSQEEAQSERNLSTQKNKNVSLTVERDSLVTQLQHEKEKIQQEIHVMNSLLGTLSDANMTKVMEHVN